MIEITVQTEDLSTKPKGDVLRWLYKTLESNPVEITFSERKDYESFIDGIAPPNPNHTLTQEESNSPHTIYADGLKKQDMFYYGYNKQFYLIKYQQ